MRKIRSRDEFLTHRKHMDDRMVNEMMTNDVNWGDSLLGRLINSVLRKGAIFRNMNKMDIVIRALNEEFEKLAVTIEVSQSIKGFYIIIATALLVLRENMKNKSRKNADLIKDIETCINTVEGVPLSLVEEEYQDVAGKDKENVLKNLNELLGQFPDTKDTQDEVDVEEKLAPLGLPEAYIKKALELPEADIKKVLELPEANIKKILELPEADLKKLVLFNTGVLTTLLEIPTQELSLFIQQSEDDRVMAKYTELVEQWKENQKKEGKSNMRPGEGTRKRLMAEAREQVGGGKEQTKTEGEKKKRTYQPGEVVDRHTQEEIDKSEYKDERNKKVTEMSPELIEHLYGLYKVVVTELGKVERLINDGLRTIDEDEGKKIMRTLRKYLHPDSHKSTPFRSILKNNEMEEIDKGLTDVESFKKASAYLLGIISNVREKVQEFEKNRKPIQVKFDDDPIVRAQLPSVRANFHQIHSRWSKENPGQTPSDELIKKWIRDSGGKLDERFRVLSNWNGFQMIREQEGRDTTDITPVMKFDKQMTVLKGDVRQYDEKFGYMLMDSYTSGELQIRLQLIESEMTTTEDKNIDFDPVIEIVRLFNRAYRLHTPGVIPSGRTSGKVSNSVFREYEYVGESSTGTPDTPGGGPYRNIDLFDKWYDAVMDIIRNPKYQAIFNEKTSFRFSPADRRFNVAPGTKGNRVEGGGKALKSFMNACLDGAKMYKKGAQQEFMSKYFKTQIIDSKSLGYTGSDVVDNGKVSSRQKEESVFEFRSVDKGNVSDKLVKNTVFRIGEGDKWYYFQVTKRDGEMWAIVFNHYPFTQPNENSFKGRVDTIKTRVSTERPEVYLYKGSVDGIVPMRELELEKNVKGVENNITLGPDFELLYADGSISTSFNKRHGDNVTKVDRLRGIYPDFFD